MTQTQTQPPATGGNAGASFASASLYVGGLHPEATEATLYEVFNVIGPVASIRVCRDAITRRSLCYAYVNFHNAVDAEQALDVLNYTDIKGRPCRIMWCHRDPAMRKSQVGNVFIKNLDKAIDDKALRDAFSNFGHILSCKVARDDAGNSRGYGFIHFDDPKSADKAIDGFNGVSMNDKVVYVGRFISKKDRAPSGDVKFTNVYVKNVDESVTQEELEAAFAKFGEITSAKLEQKEGGGGSKGFGFICYKDAEAAKAAVDAMHDEEFGGKKLYVSRAMKKAERESFLKDQLKRQREEQQSKYQQGVNLFVKNLDDGVNEDKLREAFAKFGQITSHKIMRDETGNSRGFGFVCYTTPDEATKAVTEMNGQLLGGKPIYVALHQRKDLRRQMLEAQHANMRNAAAGMANPAMYPLFMQNMAGGGRQGYFLPGQRPNFPRTGGVTGRGNNPGVPGGMSPQNTQAMYYAAMMSQGRGAGPNGMAGRAPGAGGRGGAAGSPAGAAGAAGNRARQGFKYNQTARNQGQTEMAGGQYGVANPNAAAALAAGAQPGQLTAAQLANADPKDQKKLLGERLYPMVYALQPAQAAKITGMFLEMENSEVLLIMSERELLEAKVSEAVQVLDRASGAAAPANGAAAPAAAAAASE